VSEVRSTPIRVLVIDDSEEIRDVIRRALGREADFQVVAEATSGESGVAAAAAHQPDLVLLDIAMSDMDGLQALPLIRSAVPDASVVMLSGFSEQAAAISALEHGAHAYIRKGLSVPDLLDQLLKVVEMRRQRREQAPGR
jgi:DNA-binding NarL/FixJ family response regulator